VKKQAETI